MLRKSILINRPQGLEDRPIAELVQVASKYESRVYLEHGSRKVKKSFRPRATSGANGRLSKRPRNKKKAWSRGNVSAIQAIYRNVRYRSRAMSMPRSMSRLRLPHAQRTETFRTTTAKSVDGTSKTWLIRGPHGSRKAKR